MTRLLFINPNSTQSMTAKVLAAAHAVGAESLDIRARTSTKGPASIQGPADGEASLPGLFEEIDKGMSDGMDGFVIACFDDTGLQQARVIAAPRPVLGLCEAACHACTLAGLPFSIVTTLAVSIPVIEANVQAYGMHDHCRRVRASGVPVLALEDPDSGAEQRVSGEVARAIGDDGSKAIVLGCAGMADLADRLAEQHGVPVIDGVVAATRLAAVFFSIQGVMRPDA